MFLKAGIPEVLKEVNKSQSEREQTSQWWADGMMDPINQVLAGATRSGASTQPQPLL